MTSLLGIDLGTSSVKVVVFAVDGTIRGIGSAEYPILTPLVGYAEQDPADWWRATVSAVRQAMDKAGRPDISGIGFSGQMHGFVLIRADKAPLQPAIIWADQRSADLLEEIQGSRWFGPAKMRNRPGSRLSDLVFVLASETSTAVARSSTHLSDAQGLRPVQDNR